MVPGSPGGSEGSVTGRVQTQPAWRDGTGWKQQVVVGGLYEIGLNTPLAQRAHSPALSLFPLPSGCSLPAGGQSRVKKPHKPLHLLPSCTLGVRDRQSPLARNAGLFTVLGPGGASLMSSPVCTRRVPRAHRYSSVHACEQLGTVCVFSEESFQSLLPSAPPLSKPELGRGWGGAASRGERTKEGKKVRMDREGVGGPPAVS